jgi:uncharacterized protein
MPHTGAETPAAAAPNTNPPGIFVDAEGDWYHDGNRILRENIIALFLQSLSLNPSGKYEIQCNQERYELEAADTPFVVSRVDRELSADSGKEEILLRFRHLSQVEPLDSSSLTVGKGNILYCTVRNGRFPARFSRPAYYQLAQWIEEDSETCRFVLILNGIRHSIAYSEDKP